MIIDNTLLFSDGQLITVSAASTNSIDTGTTGTPYGFTTPLVKDLGRDHGHPDLAVRVKATFAGLTSMQVQVQVSDDAATWTTVESSAVVPAASLVAGYQFAMPDKLPEGTNKRYVQLYYLVVGTATAGSVTASMVASRNTNNTFGGN